MAKRRRRRNWSEDEKRMICAQTRFPGVSVSQVTRRYDVSANCYPEIDCKQSMKGKVFNWLKDPLFATPPEDADVTNFLPVEVVDPVPVEHVAAEDTGEMQIGVAGGHRLTISGSFCPDALAQLIRKIGG